MKRFFSRLIPVVPVVTVLASMIFSHSCANTTQSPSGGQKDTIPPVITKIYPPMQACNVPVHGIQLVYTFNEYVTVKNGKNIFLSPPQIKSPKYKIKGKSVVVSFEEDLLPNTTYTLSMTDAVADNNEGNMFPGFTHVFSTGDTVDSLMLTGVVQDCNTLMPVKGATVLLYKDPADSAVYKQRPFAAVKTDDWGFFCLRNIKDTLYRLYAINDENNNNLYDPETENIAFADSLLRPTTVVNDTLPELAFFEMTDTLACLARKTEYELNLFREKPSKQLIVRSGRPSDRSAYIAFMAPNAHIDTMWVKGIPAKNLITQFNPLRDSLEIWLNDRRTMPDTLHVFVNYRKTDTLGVLSPFTEEVKLIGPNAGKTKAQRNSTKNLKHEDTICVFKLNAEPERVEQYGFELEFSYPLLYEAFDSVSFWALNPKQQRIEQKFTVEPDTLNLRCYTIRPEDSFLPGYEYYLKVPHRQFKDINGHLNDSLQVKVALPDDETLSSLTLDCTGVGNKYIVDLLNEKRDNVMRSFIISSDGSLKFPYLKKGLYCIRITEDKNMNSLVDTGDLLSHRQPEKVKFYKIKDSYLIDIPEKMEINQSIDFKELFGE